MNDIELRAFDVDLKDYFPFDTIDFLSRTIQMGELFDGELFPAWDRDLSTGVILEEFTGIKDKHHIKIYEGDIIKVYQNDLYIEFIGTVIKKACGYYIDCPETKARMKQHIFLGDIPGENYLEIVGNINNNTTALDEFKKEERDQR